jgi:hypothetical protein
VTEVLTIADELHEHGIGARETNQFGNLCGITGFRFLDFVGRLGAAAHVNS